MKLASMKLPKKPKSSTDKCCEPISCGQDVWPYGLRLRFEKEQVAQLPSLKDYKVGDKVVITAEGTVISLRVSESQGKDGNNESYSVEIQLEDVGCEPKAKKDIKEMSPKEYRKARENGAV
jgi:ribosomal protein L21E